MTKAADMIAKLNAMYSHRGDGFPTQYVNPDGPEAATLIAHQERRIEALEKMIGGKWFYAEGYDQDMCRDSPEEIIEEMSFRPGERDVVRIDVASPMPSQWYLVERLTEEQKDVADSDDDFKITQYPSEAEARSALESDNERL